MGIKREKISMKFYLVYRTHNRIWVQLKEKAREFLIALVFKQVSISGLPRDGNEQQSNA